MKKFLMLAATLIAVNSAYAQLTEKDITYNSKCGSEGVGMQFSATETRAKDEIHRRDGEPGHYVTKNGYWTSGCTMPAKPKDCAPRAVDPWSGKNGWGLCVPAKYSILRAHNEGITQQVHTAANKPGSSGYQTWTCVKKSDGTFGWELNSSVCK